MTSCEPNFAFKMPGIAPQIPPTAIAVKIQSGTSKNAGRLAHGRFGFSLDALITVPPSLIPIQAVANDAT
jgi:hypothetical protein